MQIKRKLKAYKRYQIHIGSKIKITMKKGVKKKEVVTPPLNLKSQKLE